MSETDSVRAMQAAVRQVESLEKNAAEHDEIFTSLTEIDERLDTHSRMINSEGSWGGLLHNRIEGQRLWLMLLTAGVVVSLILDLFINPWFF